MIGPANTGGGPYLVLSEAAAASWSGSADAAAYDAVCRGPDEGRLAQVAGRTALVLGTPDPLYFAPTPRGGVFARVVFFDADDDALLATILEKLPQEGWTPMGTLEVDGPMFAFDSAARGDEAAGEGLTIEMEPGRYEVSSMTFSPEGAELMLTRLEMT